MTAWISLYAGFRSVRTYVLTDVGRSQIAWFGSFQIVHSVIHGYRVAAARANPAKAARERGA
jgi:hypothetical protein